MISAKKSFGTAVLVALFVWIASPLSGEEALSFLKGKVHFLDRVDLALVKKFESAEKEFKKSKSGDTYFTCYTFLSRYEFHTGAKCLSSGSYKVTIKNNDIKLRRISKWRKKSGEYFKIEDGSEPAGIIFLHRISKNKGEIVDARVINLDHTYEFQEEPVYWLGDADNNESFRFLEGLFDSGTYDLQKTLVFAISSHDNLKAYDFLRRVALGSYAKELRKNAIFWLGNYKDEKSLGYLKEINKREKDAELKKQVIFALQLSDQKEAVAELIKIAKTDSSQKVRKNAIFWLGQKASEESIRALKDVVEESEEIEVKNSAVFAISQLPKEKAVSMLIDIARSNKSPSVRKNAIFWLGQTGDKEALKFFEEILFKKK